MQLCSLPVSTLKYILWGGGGGDFLVPEFQWINKAGMQIVLI